MKTRMVIPTGCVLAAATLLLGLALVASPAAYAQSGGAPASRVGVIDISYIFKNHTGFNAAMEAMKQEVMTFEQQLKQRGDQIAKLTAELNEFNPNSDEYKQVETQIYRLKAEGQALATTKKREFLQKEARIYFDTYNQIVAEVGRFCDQYGFGLVVRFNSEEINPDDRNSVLEGVNRAVVYQKNLNITYAVLERLGMKQEAAARTTQSK